MALRLEGVAVDGVGQLLRRVVAEVHRLAGIGADAGRHEEHPRQQLAARLVGLRRQELAGLLGEIEQDRARIEHDGVAIDDGRHLGVRIDLEEFRLVLVALAGVDRNRFVRQAGLFEKQRDLGRVRRGGVIELQHRLASFGCYGTAQAVHDLALEQAHDLAVGADVDGVGRRHLGQARHGHDLAADRDDELGAGGRAAPRAPGSRSRSARPWSRDWSRTNTASWRCTPAACRSPSPPRS